MRELENKKVLEIGVSYGGQASGKPLPCWGAKPRNVGNATVLNRGARPIPMIVEPCRNRDRSGRVLPARTLFAPCAGPAWLLEANTEAAKKAASGGIVLLSPAGSSIDQFRNRQHPDEVFCLTVKSMGRGVRSGTPNINGKNGAHLTVKRSWKHMRICSGVF